MKKRAILAVVLMTMSHATAAAAESDDPVDSVVTDAPDDQPAVEDPRVECIIEVESRGDPNATNPRSGAAGLGQFLRGTWLTTPQGQAGYSVYNAAANRAAVAWMLSVGRAREFVAVSGGWC